MYFGKNIRLLRKRAGYSQDFVAEKTGYKSYTTVQKWETTDSTPPMNKLKALADLFNVSMTDLISRDLSLDDRWPTQVGEDVNVYAVPDSGQAKINIYGKVPAGVPVEAIENVIGEESIPSDWLSGEQEYIALRVSGDSMYPKYLDGDIVIIKLQPDCESGQDAVVYVNGYDATLKTVIKQGDGMIRLQPTNPEFQPKVFQPKDITILGVVKRLRRDF